MTTPADLLSSGRNADCTIHCRDLTMKLHKCHLTTRSSYFSKLFDGPFEEANTSVATMDEEPSLLARAVEYMYLNKYSETTLLVDTTQPGHGQFGEIKDTYEGRHPIFLHIDMFHFAEVFSIHGLTQEATKGFARHWFTAFHPEAHRDQPVTFSDLDAEVIEAIYEQPVTDFALRDMVVIGQKCNIDEYQALNSATLKDTIKIIPGFALDMIQKPLIWPGRPCLNCGSRQPVLWEKCSCGMWSECSSTHCMKALVAKMKCYNCEKHGFGYPQHQPTTGTILEDSHLQYPSLYTALEQVATNLQQSNAMAAGIGTMLKIGAATVSPMPTS